MLFSPPPLRRIHLAYVPSYVFARLPCYCYVLQENVKCGVGWASVASQISFITLVKFGQNELYIHQNIRCNDKNMYCNLFRLNINKDVPRTT